ncbi:MAG: DUF1016 N-terminal domain-containing protein [Gemmatimonadota bacterium]|nr:DUF1016 N-terminal domain-containing protein [Gemmatimonadota bacterium]
MSEGFDFERLVELCQRTHEETRRSAVRAIDRSLVVRNWLFGWYIVEYEQSGIDRAEYGAQLLSRMAHRFRKAGIRGASATSLKRFRQFYRQRRRIRPTLLDQSRHPSSLSLLDVIAWLRGRFPLGWSHYIALLPVTDPDARHFYEIEAADNGWSVRELKRQLDSSLYQRLALSRDKHEVRRLARDGQVVEKASDLIKDPVVLEFLGLEEKPAYPAH